MRSRKLAALDDVLCVAARTPLAWGEKTCMLSCSPDTGGNSPQA